MKWFVLAFLLRFLLITVKHHPDADSFFSWGKYLWEKKEFLSFLGESVPDAVRANYPPVYYYLLLFWRGIYELLGNLLWWINVNVSVFPSNLIPLYQTHDIGVAFNKIPIILSDIGCAYVISKILDEISGNSFLKRTAVLLFLFLPATWYNSVIWGQIDSLYALFLLLSYYLLLKDKYLLSVFAMAFSGLVKPIGLFVLPVYLIYFLKKRKIKDLIIGVFASVLLSYILFFPFQPINTLSWSYNFYIGNFQGELNNLVYNALNFWELIFGFKNIPSADFKTLFFTVSVWGKIIFTLFVLIIVIALWKNISKQRLIIASFLCAFAAFLFLPKMHDRYFYTAMIFLPIISCINKKYIVFYLLLSTIHLLNLYRFWWYPKINFIIPVLSNITVIRFIIMINILAFFTILYHFITPRPSFKVK